MSTWPRASLSRLGVVVTGSTPRTSEPAFYGGAIPFVTPSELDRTEPITTTPRTLSDTGARVARLLPAGTVMVCCIGSLGKVGIAGTAIATNQQINSIIFDQQLVYPRYGYYACRLLKAQLETMAPATTLAIVTKSKFESLEIPVPSLIEQRRIATLLDKVNTLRQQRRIACENIEVLFQSIFTHMFGTPSTNSKQWKMVTLGDVLTDIRNGFNASQADDTAGWPVTRIETIWNGTIDRSRMGWTNPSPALLREFRLKRGDILFSHINSPDHIGKTALYDGEPEVLIHGINLLRLSANRSQASPLWLLHFLKHVETRRYFRTRCKKAVNQASLNQQDIKTLGMFLPPLKLQQVFADRAAAVARVEVASRAHLATLDTLFEALQQRVFAGNLCGTVSDDAGEELEAAE
jgi:type I restriction enzyme, S subunit